MKFNLLHYCEIDKYAALAYSNIYKEPQSKNLGDITQVEISKLPTCDLITHGSPCFVAGTKVLTSVGYKNIEDIKLGDFVLTHTNTYKKVTRLYKNESSNLYTLEAQCSASIVVTGNHPFYVRKKYTDYRRKSETYCKRLFKDAEWLEVDKLSKDYFLGVAINNIEEYPKWNGVPNNRNNQSHLPINNLNKLFTDMRFWYLVGRFMGDGWVTEGYSETEKKPTYRTTVCCAFDELEDLEEKIFGLFEYSKVKDTTVYKLQFSNKELTLFLKQFGKGAKNKHLTESIINLPKSELTSFLQGYLESDGYANNQCNIFKMSSVSEELLLGIGQVIAKLYNKPFSIYKNKPRKKEHRIDGRVVKQGTSYTVTFKPNESKTHGFYEAGILWMPIRSVNKLESAAVKDVYNLEVEDDHTYTVNNMIVHNCTDFSLAGNQAGADEGSGTRSSLIWNSVEIIAQTKPKFVLWENVANVLNGKHRVNFDKYLSKMEDLGYNSYYKVLIASDYNVPQSRKRIFVLSIRKDIDTGYLFPEGVPLQKGLYDIILSNVDEKYNLSERALKGIENTKFNQAKTRIQTGHICQTILARDYKDPKVVIQNGVARKLTPQEYWRVQGFKDEQFFAAQEAVSSNMQLYKQAGNSIAVGVVTHIFQALKQQYPNDFVENMNCISLFSGIGAFESGLANVE